MFIEVAFLPSVLRHAERKVCVMIDVLRASTSIVAMFDRGAAGLELAASAEAAVAAAAGRDPRPIIGGEVGGLPPAGFDYGNSPEAYLGADLKGREIVFCTSNGTRACADLAAAPAVLIGGLRNLTAVSRAAYALAEAGGHDLALVCAGRALGTNFGLDDLFCAGAMVDVLARERGLVPGAPTGLDPAALISGGATPPDLRAVHESATAAWRVYQSYGGDARAAFAESGNGQALEDLNLLRDLEICAESDKSALVPRLVRGDPLRIVL